MAQAQGMNIYEDPKKVRAQIKQERKKLKQQEKQHNKEMRAKGKELEAREAELEQPEGGITSFFLTIAIIVMWLLIMSLLIRLDVGRFGSTVTSARAWPADSWPEMSSFCTLSGRVRSLSRLATAGRLLPRRKLTFS